MPNLTPDIQSNILTALQTKFAGVSGVDNFLIKNPLLDSKTDAVDVLTVENSDGELEVKYIYLSFLGFEDSLTDGCEDDPSVSLTYNAHCFWQYQELRADGSYSERDFVNLILNLRNEFLKSNRVILTDTETTPLKQNNFIILGDDPLTGAYGFYCDLTVKVEII